jgi:hypothetical protein
MSKKYSDLVFGKLKEVEIKEILEQYFNTKLNTSSKYNLIDFYNDEALTFFKPPPIKFKFYE